MAACCARPRATLGRGRVRSLHLNDSQTPLGSNRDRHANIGDGELGEAGCAAFLSAPAACSGFPACSRPRAPTAKARPREEVAHAIELRERGIAARG